MQLFLLQPIRYAHMQLCNAVVSALYLISYSCLIGYPLLSVKWVWICLSFFIRFVTFNIDHLILEQNNICLSFFYFTYNVFLSLSRYIEVWNNAKQHITYSRISNLGFHFQSMRSVGTVRLYHCCLQTPSHYTPIYYTLLT
jgi:hypothetical protein